MSKNVQSNPSLQNDKPFLVVIMNIKLVFFSLFFSIPSYAVEFTCNSDAAPTTAQYSDIVNCSLDTDSEVDVYAFQVTEGDTFAITISQNSDCSIKGGGFHPFIRVLDANGNNEGGESARCPDGVRFEVTANYTGVYTAIVENDYGNEWGSYQIRFQCLGGSCIQQTLLRKELCEANFDGNLLDIPYLSFGSQSFWVKMNLVNSNPIQLQLSDFGNR